MTQTQMAPAPAASTPMTPTAGKPREREEGDLSLMAY